MKKILFTAIMMTIVLTIASCGVSIDEKKEEANDVTNEGSNETDEGLEGNDINLDKEDEITNNEGQEEDTDDNDKEDEISVETPEVSLESIIEETYATTGLELPKSVASPLTKENQSYMLGVDNFDFIEGIASEPMISSQAHSVVLFTVAEDADIEGIKADIKANVDGRKWICVGVEPENIIVDNIDNMIILIMDEQSQAIHEAFLTTVN